MSYAATLALQEAVYAAVSGSAEVAALVGANVFDAPIHADAPEGVSGPYVTLGDEQVQDWSAQGLCGALHDVDVSVHTPEDGFAEAKRISSAVVDAVTGGLPALSAGRVVTSDFVSARTRRVKDAGRRIDLRFRFRIEL